MPWYECPRCGSQDAFFQKGQELNNGLETYTDVHGRTQFRSNLNVSDVSIPYCRECMVVKMNSYLTQEEIDKRNRNRYLFAAVGIIILVLIFGNNKTSNNASVTSSETFSVTSTSSNESIYVSDLNDDGSHEIDRNKMVNGVDECGNSLPDEVLTIDPLIPVSWKLLEFNGCGSGSSYEWVNSNNKRELIQIEYHADAGWCGDLNSEDFDSAVKDRVLGFKETIQEFSRIENSDVAKYAYLKTTSDGKQSVLGVISVGTISNFCGNGDFRLEATLVDSEAALFKTVAAAVF